MLFYQIIGPKFAVYCQRIGGCLGWFHVMKAAAFTQQRIPAVTFDLLHLLSLIYLFIRNGSDMPHSASDESHFHSSANLGSQFSTRCSAQFMSPLLR